MKTPPKALCDSGGVDFSCREQLGISWHILPQSQITRNSSPHDVRKLVSRLGYGCPSGVVPDLWNQGSVLDLHKSGQVNPLTPGALNGETQPMLDSDAQEGYRKGDKGSRYV